MPDLNSLPPSRGPSQVNTNHNSPESGRPQPQPPSPLSRLSSGAMASAAVHTAHGRNSPQAERRRSSVLASWNLNDPDMPLPSPTADPNHHRPPSLGQLHQELENEQEAQVNRLLRVIRQQQAQLHEQMQQQGQQGQQGQQTQNGSTATPRSPTSGAVPSQAAISSSPGHSATNRPSLRTSDSFRRQSSSSPHSRRASSASNSQAQQQPLSQPLPPALPFSNITPPLPSPSIPAQISSRDNIALLSSFTEDMMRENQMLKRQVAELERKLAAAGVSGDTVNPHLSSTATTTPDQTLTRTESASTDVAQGTVEFRETHEQSEAG